MHHRNFITLAQSSTFYPIDLSNMFPIAHYKYYSITKMYDMDALS